MAKKAAKTTPIPLGNIKLTAEDRAAIEDEARKSVLEEMAQQERDAYFQKMIAEYRRANTPQDQIVSVMIDVAPYVPYIMIDATQYFPNYTYEVPRKLAAVLLEIMSRSWNHQDEIEGRSRFAPYRRPLDTRIGPRHAGTVTRGFAPGQTITANMDDAA